MFMFIRIQNLEWLKMELVFMINQSKGPTVKKICVLVISVGEGLNKAIK